MSLSSEAKALMNNEAFKAAVEQAQKDLIAKVLSCDPKDDQGRRLYAEAANIVGKVTAHIVALATTESTDNKPVEDFYEQRSKSVLAALFGN